MCILHVSVLLWLVSIFEDEQKIEGDQNSREQKSGNASKGIAKNQRKLKGKGPKVSLRSNSEDSGSNSAKPSFPGKKRVQVPQYPLSETPGRPAKFDDSLCEMDKGGSKDNSFVLKEKPALDDKGELIFSPFFWLREDEDVEMSSQQMDVDLTLSSSLPNVPSFSDIKGSDDDMPSELEPEVSCLYFVHCTEFGYLLKILSIRGRGG